VDVVYVVYLCASVAVKQHVLSFVFRRGVLLRLTFFLPTQRLINEVSFFLN